MSSSADVSGRSRADRLLDTVRRRILLDIDSAGQWIKQDALAAELGISKIPLREALVRLEQEGLVTSEANRGFFVSPLSRSEAEEVFALRLKLEPEAVAAAAALATAEERRAAQDAYAALEAATNAHSEEVGTLNRAFHIALIRPGRQPVTSGFIEQLHAQAERYVRKHLEPLGRDTRANEEHDEILAVWLAAEADRAAALTRQHIVKTLEDLRKQLG